MNPQYTKFNIPILVDLKSSTKSTLTTEGLPSSWGMLEDAKAQIKKALDNLMTNKTVFVIAHRLSTIYTADKIIVISEDFKKNIMAKGVPEEKIELVYNWVNENQVVNVDRKDNILFDKYNLDRDKFYICYSGNVGYTQNMDMLVNVAKSLQDNENIGFVIIGEGAYKSKLEELVKENNLTNITLLPFQDYSDISHVFSLGDAGLIISKKGVGTNSVPSKTWSIMSASRPVLASFDKGSELDRIVTENSLGVCVEADDADALKNTILELCSKKEELQKMGSNGREFILKNLTTEIGTSKVINVLKNV